LERATHFACAGGSVFVCARGRSDTRKIGTAELAVAVGVGLGFGTAVAVAAAVAVARAGAVGVAVAGAAAVALAAAAAGAAAVATTGCTRVLTCAGTCVVAPTASVTVTSHVTNTAYHPMGLGIPLVRATSYASIAVACRARTSKGSCGRSSGSGTEMTAGPCSACILSSSVV